MLHSYESGVPFAVEERSGIVTVIRELDDFERSIYEFEAVAAHVSTVGVYRLNSSQLNRFIFAVCSGEGFIEAIAETNIEIGPTNRPQWRRI